MAKKLTLSRETLNVLLPVQLTQVEGAGGFITVSCPTTRTQGNSCVPRQCELN